jgi:predicted lysophospholipase L1 biosynthesis ABC-type transport system permease subunit
MNNENRQPTRQINLPLRRAVEISLRSLSIRFWRSLVTSAVIFLAIAFFTYMISTELVSSQLEVGEVLTKPKGEEAQRLWVASISLLVAGIGILNTLLMSVAERYREIGTMKCLGALNRFVVELFLLEACAMGAIGSGAGALAGAALATLPWFMRAPELAQVGLPAAGLGMRFLLGLGLGMGLTTLGAIYPAYRAAKMAPAEAMRTEV